MSQISVDNVINVSITDTPSGLTEKNVNSLILLTHEQPAGLDSYIVAIAPSTVIEQYGTNSVTAKMANAVFAQSPNLRTGKGRLIVAPMQAATPATAGRTTTADLTAVLAAILAVTDGFLRVTVNAVNYDLTGINFASAETWADIAKVLQAKLPVAVVTATANGIRIDSKKVGTTSAVVFGNIPGPPAGTNLNGAGFFNGATATNVAGTNSSGETVLQAIARLDGSVGCVGVMTSLDLEDAVVTATANAIQSMDKLFFHHFASPTDIAGFATANKAAGNKKTRPLLHTNSIAAANLYKAAYAGRALSVNFSGSFTAQTMNLKQLATIQPGDGITQTLYEAAKVAGIDIYVSYDGVPSVLSTGGNDFFDNQYCDLALKFALQTGGFNYLRQTNTKVPQTEKGMDGLKSAYAQVMERFIRNGSVAPGQWTSSETFGDPVIFNNNILTRGYYIYSLPIVQQAATEREQRIAPLCQIAVKRAGAIHSDDVIVLIND
jgi:hypothetical protein